MEPVGSSVPSQPIAAQSERDFGSARSRFERAAARPAAARAEVEISERARIRRDPPSEDRPRATDRPSVSEVQRAEAQAPPRGPSPIIAVRVGVPPASEAFERIESDRALEAGLRERAQLRDLTQVVSLPVPAAEASESASAGEAAASTTADSRTPVGRTPAPLQGELGAEAAPALPERPQLDLPERAQLVARDVRAPRPAPAPPQSLPALQLELQRSEEQSPSAPVQSERLTDATAVLGSAGSGAVRDPNESSAREQPLLGGSRDAEREADRRRLEQSATQFAGTVDAAQRDALVTRFLGDVPNVDPGPVPRPRA